MIRSPEPPEEDVGEAPPRAVAPPELASAEAPSSRFDLSIRHRRLAVDLKIGRYEGPGEDNEPGHSRSDRLGWARRMRRGRSPHRTGSPKPAAPEPLPNVRLVRKSSESQTHAVDAMSFWDALAFKAKQDFRNSANERTFASGSRLMQEGERADHVIVILDGHVQIWVDDGGTERMIALRGPGQLIGERAALQVSVRSATAIAEGTVRALSMTTENFARFVTDHHPAVLDIVEGQIYDRLIENPARLSAPVPAVPAQAQAQDHGEPSLLAGQYCLILYTDVVQFGDLARSEDQRDIVISKLWEVTAAAMTAIWDQCSCEGRGDGLLIVVPPSVPPVQVLEYLLIALPIGLKRHNALYGRGAQIRLRLALDVGPVTSTKPGAAGRVVINAARLLEAPSFKRAVLEGDADLGIIASDFVYQSTIRAASHLTDPSAYARVNVEVKETAAVAWMTLVSPPIQSRPNDGLVTTGPSS